MRWLTRSSFYSGSSRIWYPWASPPFRGSWHQQLLNRLTYHMVETNRLSFNSVWVSGHRPTVLRGSSREVRCSSPSVCLDMILGSPTRRIRMDNLQRKRKKGCYRHAHEFLRFIFRSTLILFKYNLEPIELHCVFLKCSKRAFEP